MKLSHILYDIKNTLYKGISDLEARLSDAQLEHWINVYRSKLLMDISESDHVFDDVYVQSLGCLDLECVPLIECESLELGAHPYFVRTKRKIPKLVNMGTRSPVSYVGIADGTSPIEFGSKNSALYGLKARWTSNRMRSFLHDGKIYVTNAKNLKSIYFSGVFQNPREAEIFKTGVNPKDFDYPLSYSDVEYIKKRIINFEIKMFFSVFTENIPNNKDLTLLNVDKDGNNHK